LPALAEGDADDDDSGIDDMINAPNSGPDFLKSGTGFLKIWYQNFENGEIVQVFKNGDTVFKNLVQSIQVFENRDQIFENREKIHSPDF